MLRSPLARLCRRRSGFSGSPATGQGLQIQHAPRPTPPLRPAAPWMALLRPAPSPRMPSLGGSIIRHSKSVGWQQFSTDGSKWSDKMNPMKYKAKYVHQTCLKWWKYIAVDTPTLLVTVVASCVASFLFTMYTIWDLNQHVFGRTLSKVQHADLIKRCGGNDDEDGDD